MKNDRKKAILDIVSKYEVDTQETLQALLMERGFSVTQATVSRDIKELSLLKTMGINGNYKYSLPPRAVENNARTSFSTIFSDAFCRQSDEYCSYKVQHRHGKRSLLKA